MQTSLNKNTNIFERIMQVANYKGIKNVPDLAVILKYDSPEKLYRLKRKPEAKPSYEIIEDLTNKFEDLNVRYLITGMGEPFLTDYAQKGAATPITNYHLNDPAEVYLTDTPNANRQANELKKEKSVRPTVQPTTFLSPKIVTVGIDGDENIVYVPTKAAAGYLNGYADNEYIERLSAFTLPGLNKTSYRAFEVSGDSMYPTLENKEMVIGEWVEKLDYIREDRVHILVTKNDGIIVKRLLNRVEKYGYIIAKSDAVDNRNLYPNLEIRPEDIVEVWYAVWHGGFNFKSPTEMYRKVNNLEADLSEVMRVLRNNKLIS